MKSQYLRDGSKFSPVLSEDIDFAYDLPAHVYRVGFNERTGEYFLSKSTPFTFNGEVYGSLLRYKERIISSYLNNNTGMGVLLAGEKGSGKSLLSKLISIDLLKKDIPTVIVSEPYFGNDFSAFIQQMSQRMVIIFDEFEKVYCKDQQEKLLSLFDGLFNSNKLFLVTCNEMDRVDSNFRNRPGRARYFIQFEGLDHEFIRDYCQRTLVDKSHIEDVCRLTLAHPCINFDMLKSLVDEMNVYHESVDEVLEMLNFKSRNGLTYQVILSVKNKKVPYMRLNTDFISVNPFDTSFKIRYGDEDDMTKCVKFNPPDIVDYSLEEGTVTFVKGDYKVVLAPQDIATDYDIERENSTIPPTFT